MRVPRRPLGLEYRAVCCYLIFWGWSSGCWAQPPSIQSSVSDMTQERVSWRHEKNGVRALVLAPQQLRRDRRCLIIFATPNGNTLEQTLGCRASATVDWKFDIQHVAAQVRWLRAQDSTVDYIVAVVQPSQLSWPEFRRTNPKANQEISELVIGLKDEFMPTEVTLACHSGGGSFLWGWMNDHQELPQYVQRLIFLDANYSYSTAEGHDLKLANWLERGLANSLVVVAYDDREVELNGKKVVGPDGGTYRATQRMLESFSKSVTFVESQARDLRIWRGLAGRLQLIVHQNPQKKILHTALVGEMNGLAVGMTLANESFPAPAKLEPPRIYDSWIQAEQFWDPRVSSAVLDVSRPERNLLLPPRAQDAETGSQFCERVATLDRRQREQESVAAILSGNVPSCARSLAGIKVSLPAGMGPDVGRSGSSASSNEATYFVMRDYMAIGSDDDFVRMPLTPSSALLLCDRLDCELITEKISDDIFSAADCRLEPFPLTDNREAVSAFVLHNKAIQASLQGKGRPSLLTGIKKDIVLTERLQEKTHRVALYGWHHVDGRVIQPLYVGHVDWYVDYSHGVRLISRRMFIGEVAWDIRDVLKDEDRCGLLTREGPLDVAALRSISQW